MTEQRVAKLEQWQTDHEKICGERMITVEKYLDANETTHVEMKSMIKSNGHQLWGIGILLVGGLGTISYALFNYILKNHPNINWLF